MRAAHELTDEQLAGLARMSVQASRAPDATKKTIAADIDTWLTTPATMGP
jgi:adenosine deaminase